MLFPLADQTLSEHGHSLSLSLSHNLFLYCLIKHDFYLLHAVLLASRFQSPDIVGYACSYLLVG
jgi:hypothetical protein